MCATPLVIVGPRLSSTGNWVKPWRDTYRSTNGHRRALARCCREINEPHTALSVDHCIAVIVSGGASVNECVLWVRWDGSSPMCCVVSAGWWAMARPVSRECGNSGIVAIQWGARPISVISTNVPPPHADVHNYHADGGAGAHLTTTGNMSVCGGRGQEFSGRGFVWGALLCCGPLRSTLDGALLNVLWGG